MSVLSKMVLQCSRKYIILPYCQSSCQSTPQGGSATSKQFFRRYSSRMLQLWNEERVSFGVHSGQIGYSSRSSLSTTMCGDAFIKGYELGYLKMATINRRPIILIMACCHTKRSRTITSATPEPTDDCEIGRIMERKRYRDHNRS